MARDRDGKLWLGVSIRSCRDGTLPSQRRTPLNLALALDVSGSMMNGFTDPKTEEEALAMVSKIDQCKSFVGKLRGSLLPDDSLSVSYFSEKSGTLLPRELDDLTAALPIGGGTRLLLGLQEAAANARLMRMANPEAETRIVFFTDMCDTSEDASGPRQLLLLSGELAKEGIHVSYVGVGVDFDGDTTRLVSKVPGCNCFCCLNEFDLDRIVSDLNSAFCAVAESVELNVVAPSHRIVRCVGMDRGGALETAAPWTPATHALYPRPIRAAVTAMVTSVHVAFGIRLPKEVTGEIVKHLWPAQRFAAREWSVFPSRTVDCSGFVLFQLESQSPDDDEAALEVSLRCDGVRVQSVRLPVPASLPLGCPDQGMRMALALTAVCDECKAVLPETPGAVLRGTIGDAFAEWLQKESKELPLSQQVETVAALRSNAAMPQQPCAIQ